MVAAIALAAAAQAVAQINVEQVVKIGRNALYFEDYILSIQYFNQAINARPNLAEPYFYRAVAKLSLEDYKGAEADASMCIERNPFITDAYQVRGVARQNQRKFADAIADYTHGLGLMPEDKAFLLNRAVCEQEEKQYDASAADYARLLRLDSKNDRGYLGLAQLNLAQADTTAALANVARSIEINRDNVNAYLMRAEILMRRDSFALALPDMDQAIKLEPHNAGYFINRAYMKYKTDDYFGAMADYNYAVDLDPASMEAHFNRGMLNAQVGETNNAIDDFTFVLRADSHNFMARYNRALLYYRTGQMSRAISDFNAVLAKYPKFEAGYMARGEAKRRMGDAKGCERDFATAVAIMKRRGVHYSDYNPANSEAAAAANPKAADAAAASADADTAQTLTRFNELLTVKTDSKIKPEYANRSRGHIQNTDVEVAPEPMFMLTYFAPDNKLNGRTNYLREVTEVNQSHLLGTDVGIAGTMPQLTEDQIKARFSSVDYYNGMLAVSNPRSIDYFGRAMDYLMLKNPAAAIDDATRAIAKSPKFALAYFLRANARFMQHQMAADGGAAADAALKPAQGQAAHMLRGREGAQALTQVIADLDSTLKLSPANVYAVFDKGNAYMLMGDYTSAISCYSRAIDMKPDMGEAYYNRGLMYMRMGNRQRGVADMSKAGELGILPSYNVLKRMAR